MQKTLSVVLIFIIMALPMLSVSASVSSCHHTNQQTTDSTQAFQQHTIDMSMTDENCMSSDIKCKHSDICSCDNGQAAYSPITSIRNTVADYRSFLQQETFSNFFLSNTPDSPYRPPIAIL